jgi:hypothetical protein
LPSDPLSIHFLRETCDQKNNYAHQLQCHPLPNNFLSGKQRRRNNNNLFVIIFSSSIDSVHAGVRALVNSLCGPTVSSNVCPRFSKNS